MASKNRDEGLNPSSNPFVAISSKKTSPVSRSGVEGQSQVERFVSKFFVPLDEAQELLPELRVEVECSGQVPLRSASDGKVMSRTQIRFPFSIVALIRE